MSDIVLAKTSVQSAMQMLAQALSNVDDSQLPAAIDFLNQLVKTVTDNNEVLRERALAYTRQYGAPVTDKGTLETQVGSHVLRAIPTRTGYDPKLVGPMLRGFKLQPEAGMDPTITYKVNPGKLEALVKAGTVDEDRMEECRYPLSYRLEVTRE